MLKNQYVPFRAASLLLIDCFANALTPGQSAAIQVQMFTASDALAILLQERRSIIFATVDPERSEQWHVRLS